MQNANLETIVAWFKACYPNPTFDVASIQYGCMLEEVGEVLQVTEDVEADILAETAYDYKRHPADYIRFFQVMPSESRAEMLDALVDIIWTATTAGTAMGFDMVGALNEVARSNYSKFEDGKPVFDRNGKVAKGKDYVKPDLKPFIGE